MTQLIRYEAAPTASSLYLRREPHRTAAGTAEAAAPARSPDAAAVRLGRLDVPSMVAYLAAWAAVLLAVWLAVVAAAYEVALRSGALASVSQSVSTVLDVDLASSGLLPIFTWSHVLTAGLVSGVVLVCAWILATVGAVLVHNAISVLTKAPRIRLVR